MKCLLHIFKLTVSDRVKTPHIKHIFTTENHVLVLLWIFSCKAAQITPPLVGISGTVKTG